jgi:hypothetical protein
VSFKTDLSSLPCGPAGRPPCPRRARAAGIPIFEKPLLGNTLVDTIQQILGR